MGFATRLIWFESNYATLSKVLNPRSVSSPVNIYIKLLLTF